MRQATRPMQRGRGFTIVELLVSLAIVGLLALVALPAYEVTVTRQKEIELRAALRSIRSAIDAYKAAVDNGQIQKPTGASGYPPALDVLEQGVDVSAPGAVTAAGKPEVKRLVFIRRVPRDPFATDPNLPAAQTWTLRAYGTPPDQPQPGDDVFDVASTSPRLGLNGIPYSQW